MLELFWIGRTCAAAGSLLFDHLHPIEAPREAQYNSHCPKPFLPGVPAYNVTFWLTPNPQPVTSDPVVVPRKSPPTQAKKPKGPPEPTIELEIQSECNWDQHRKLVLGVLCRRMTQNRLSEPFNIGRYHVHLLSNTHTCKAEGNITFKVGG